MSEHRPAALTARYLAQPHEVHRVVLLYSGGLDTSVMLKWIQDEYDAEVVALCIDLGQPTDDFEAIRQKALTLGAVASVVVDAKEEFVRDYVAPAIRANARYQGTYPLFTALFLETNPIPVKEALALMGRIDGEVRLPLCPMGQENREKLTQALKHYGLVS